jgi:hypothetical protein
MRIPPQQSTQIHKYILKTVIREKVRLGMVAYTCNHPSCLGGRDWEDRGLRPVCTKSLRPKSQPVAEYGGT